MAEPQLPDTDVKTVADIFGILRRRKWNVVVPALAVFGLAWQVLSDCTTRRSLLPFVLLVGMLWTPIGISLVASDFNPFFLVFVVPAVLLLAAAPGGRRAQG